MTANLSYGQLLLRTAQLERELLNYVRREKTFNQERRRAELRHFKRAQHLIRINAELHKEIAKLKDGKSDDFLQASENLHDRIKELNCLYNISKAVAEPYFTLSYILRKILNLVPPAFQYPEITCARIALNRHYQIKTENFRDTQWKLSKELIVNNERIGTFEVCYLEKKPDLTQGPFPTESIPLVAAIAESISQIIEREWIEVDIRRFRNRIEELVSPK